jgi:hypothetical protein
MCISNCVKIEYPKEYGWKVMWKTDKGYRSLWDQYAPYSIKKGKATRSNGDIVCGYSDNFGFFSTRKEARLYKQLFSGKRKSHNWTQSFSHTLMKQYSKIYKLVVVKVRVSEVYEGKSDESFEWGSKFGYNKMLCCNWITII